MIIIGGRPCSCSIRGLTRVFFPCRGVGILSRLPFSARSGVLTIARVDTSRVHIRTHIFRGMVVGDRGVNGRSSYRGVVSILFCHTFSRLLNISCP